jgi:hypothetical protein
LFAESEFDLDLDFISYLQVPNDLGWIKDKIAFPNLEFSAPRISHNYIKQKKFHKL